MFCFCLLVAMRYMTMTTLAVQGVFWGAKTTPQPLVTCLDLVSPIFTLLRASDKATFLFIRAQYLQASAPAMERIFHFRNSIF